MYVVISETDFAVRSADAEKAGKEQLAFAQIQRLGPLLMPTQTTRYRSHLLCFLLWWLVLLFPDASERDRLFSQSSQMQDEESLTMLIDEMKACQQKPEEERMKVKVQRYALALHRPDVYLRDLSLIHISEPTRPY